ncbi:MAG: hypothetical protein HWE15_13475 [Algoriphagus sp.]|uniref:DUF6992 family protein n=1 Tax=Algoriphagus sp. TaxID=1872435 RepID=UPI0018499207|nr:hypothetical protein [Algoriphagus sp.]NVJ87315.1 hypothetical protein [Algoriphagus sp.]
MNQKQVFFFLIIVFSFCLSTEIFAQTSEELSGFNEMRLDYNRKGMLILGTWAIGNMIWGGIAAGQTTGEVKAFHQMNLYWNSVNLLIAGFGYWQATQNPDNLGLLETINAQNSIEKILLFNAALDVAYVSSGFYLKERGLRKSNLKLQGFGKALMLQGAFLFVFDGVMYAFHQQHGQEIPAIFEQLTLGLTGFSLNIPLN